MRGKCERGHGSVNADGGSVNAGAEVQTQTGRVRKPSRAMGTRRGRLSAPWPRFHGVDRADVYIIIHVRACCCGECALNPPTSQPIPRRRPSLAPAQRHALPEHFRSPTQCRRTPAGCAMHSPPTAQPIPRRRPPLAPAQRHALAEHFRSPTQPRRTPTQSRTAPAGCAKHSPPKPFARPRTATRPPRTLPLPHAAPTPARRLRDAFPAEALRSLPAAPRCLPFRSASGTKKRHRTVHVRCRMSRSTVVAVGHLGW